MNSFLFQKYNQLSTTNFFKNNSNSNGTFLNNKKVKLGIKNLKLSMNKSNNYKLQNTKKYILNTEENINEKNNIKHKSCFSQENSLYSFNPIKQLTRNSNINPIITELKNKNKIKNNFSLRLKKNDNIYPFFSNNMTPNVSKVSINLFKNENKKSIYNSPNLNNKEDEKFEKNKYEKIDRKKFYYLLDSNFNNNQEENEKKYKMEKNNIKVISLNNSPEEIHFYIVNNIQKINALQGNYD